MASLEQRLEQGELVVYPKCPFAVPEGEDRAFLRQQQLRALTHKNINYDPQRKIAAGFTCTSDAQAERLRTLLAAFSASATEWLAQTLPRYQSGCRPDRATFRSEEEATRRLRQTARNDLLHVDAFPNRPSRGRRILRVWTNIHATEPRVWVTSELFPRLLERFGTTVGLPRSAATGWLGQVSHRIRKLFGRGELHPSVYDSFMLRLHDFLKTNDAFQEHSRKRLWTFPPGATWLLFTDGCTYAELRGRFALEHSYFIEPRALASPEQAPAALLQRAAMASFGSRAA